MTSTSFNVGLSDGKLSSRVLRPPGGGHTDIFGKVTEPERRLPRGAAAAAAQTNGVQNINPPPTPEEAHVPLAEPYVPMTEPQVPLLEPHVPLSEPLNIDTTPEPKPEPVKEPAPVVPRVEPPRRVRVPPGGFSSGLW